MKKTFILTLIIILCICTACCGKSINNEYIPDGIYIKVTDDNTLPPYIRFSSENMTSVCGGSLAMSYALPGTYTVEGNTVTITDKDTDGNMTLRINEDITLTVLSSDHDILSLWFTEGDTLTVYQPKQ